MKHIKTFESVSAESKLFFSCSIDIRDIGPRKVSLICNKLIDWFSKSGYRFQSKLIDVADIDPRYLKINTKNYNFIEVSKTYTSLEDTHDSSCDPIIGPEIVFMSETVDEFMQNVEIFKTSTKYNL